MKIIAALIAGVGLALFSALPPIVGLAIGFGGVMGLFLALEGHRQALSEFSMPDREDK